MDLLLDKDFFIGLIQKTGLKTSIGFQPNDVFMSLGFS